MKVEVLAEAVKQEHIKRTGVRVVNDLVIDIGVMLIQLLAKKCLDTTKDSREVAKNARNGPLVRIRLRQTMRANRIEDVDGVSETVLAMLPKATPVLVEEIVKDEEQWTM